MSKVVIKSENQSGGITAQNVTSYGTFSQENLTIAKPKKLKRNLWITIVEWIAFIVSFAVDVIALLSYYKII